MIGERIYGPIGHAVDTFAVIGTMFGVATSLGFGVLQVNSGLNYLLGVPVNAMVQVGLIIAISLIATLSVFSGLDTKVCESFIRRGIPAKVINLDNRVRFVIPSEDHNDFVYGLRIRAFTITNPLVSEVDDGETDYYRAEVFLEYGGQHYDVMGFTQKQILADVVTQYEKYNYYLHISSSEYLGEDT
ncbi:probable choline transporter [Shewanella benthica KT99]|uniref:Probable choline transporter n=1 Tax=Shewanella benthica KT99 TaxID=314608 RepID=A9DFN1_9GAMM|nr:probable choline transporter [Shewanella benthica KT99]